MRVHGSARSIDDARHVKPEAPYGYADECFNGLTLCHAFFSRKKPSFYGRVLTSGKPRTYSSAQKYFAKYFS